MSLHDLIFGKPKRKTKRKKKKKGVAVGKQWRNLEKKGKRSNYFKGYKVQTQKVSKSTKTRPDYVGYSKKNPRDRIVGDSKDVKVLTKTHVNQVKKYKGHPNYAKKGVLVVAKHTRVHKDVRKYAKDSNIVITRMRTKKKPKKKGWFEW